MRGQRDQAARSAFLAALRGGATVTAAAKVARVSRKTPYQWVERHDAEVKAALEEAAARGGRGRRTDLVEPTHEPPGAVPPEDAAELRRLAVDRLRKVLGDDNQEAKDHIAAARVALSVVVPRPTKAVPAEPGRKPETSKQTTADLIKMLGA